MRARRIVPPVLRSLTPLGWIAAMAAVALAIVVVPGGLGFRWDPFDLTRRRLDVARQTVVVAGAETDARSAEAVGQAGQVERLDAALRRLRAVDHATSPSLQIARTADDASLPLADARALRLRDHDRQLCRIASDLNGCSATPDPAGPGDDSLQPVSAARHAHIG